ncbi:MAG TPA: HlyD family efflux transporter periplasmic adaptor subunit [Minicystis sp.]|nr:HlyD family efflux transporter periplasmic adaptor subunit [Minicystis sp.]
MKRIKWSTVLFGVMVALLLGLTVRNLAAGPSYDVRDKDKALARRDARSTDGKVDVKEPLVTGDVVGGNGIIEPRERETRVAAPTAGLVSAIRVDEGDHVKKGDVLAELDHGVEEAQVMAARADVAAAKANLERTLHGVRVEDREAARADASAAKARAELSRTALARAEQLIQSGAITKEELDQKRQTSEADAASAHAMDERYRSAANGSRQEDIAAARAELASAEGRLAQNEAALERRFVRAPYDGEVLQVKARVGEYDTPGASDPILVLGDTSKLRVRMDVDERDIGRVVLGAKAYALADAFPGQRFAGTVTEIGRRMGRKNVRTDDPTERIDTKILEVVIDLDAPKGLVPGLRVTSYVEAKK